MAAASMTPMNQIKDKALYYYSKMNGIADFLTNNNAPNHLLIEKDREHLFFSIDADVLERLNAILSSSGCNSLILVLGQESQASQVTASFLGVDANGEIIQAHKLPNGHSNYLHGENTWPPPMNAAYDFKLSSDRDNIADYLR